MADPVTAAMALSPIVKSVASSIVVAAGRRLAAGARSKKDQEKIIERALRAGFTAVEDAFPSAVQEGFDSTFISRPRVVELLARYLTLETEPSAFELASHWTPMIKDSHQASSLRPRYWSEVFLHAYEQSLLSEDSEHDRRFQRAVMRQLGADSPPQAPLLSYLHWIERLTRRLDTRGMSEEPTEVDLESCFVSLNGIEDRSFAWTDRPITQVELGAIREELERRGLSAPEIEDRLEDDRLEHMRPSSGEVVSEIRRQVEAHDYLVLLGDPGCGKSTLLRYLAHRHARASLNGWDALGDSLGSTRLPILVRVAEYVEQEGWQERPFFEFVVDYPKGHACVDGAEVASLLATSLRLGGCLVLIDGLDEIPYAADRDRVAARIQRFAEEVGPPLAKNKIIVTSRVAGYRAAPLTNRFVHFRALELQAGIELFAERWSLALEESLAPDLPAEDHLTAASALARDLVRALDQHPAARELAGTPLLLTMMLLRIRVGHAIPSRRAAIYGQIATTLARSWRSLHLPAGTELPDEREVFPLLAKVATWIHENAPTGLISEDKLEEIVESEGLDKGIVSVLREHVGVLAQRAPERYGFPHRTFQEFFAGAALLDKGDGDRRVWLERHRHDSGWQQAMLLGLGWLGESAPSQVKKLLEDVVWPWSTNRETAPDEERYLGMDYMNALLCIADDVPARREFLQRVGVRLVELVDDENPPFFDWANDLGSLLQRLGQSSHSSALADSLRAQTYIDEEREFARAFVLALLEPGHPEHVASISASIRSSPRDVALRASEALGYTCHDSDAGVVALLELLADANVGVEFKETCLRTVSLSTRMDNRIRDVLLEITRDEGVSEGLRQQAIFTATSGREQSQEVAEALGAVASSAASNPDVRTTALYTLGSYAAFLDFSVEILEAVCLDEGTTFALRRTAARSLSNAMRAGTEGAEAACRRVLEADGSLVLGALALESRFFEFCPDGLSDMLAHAADRRLSEDWRTDIFEAVLATGTRETAAASALIFVARDRSESETVRNSAIRSLGVLGVGDDATIGVLIEIATEPAAGWWLRASAIDALRALGVATRDDVRGVLELLNDRGLDVSIRRSLVPLVSAASLVDSEAVGLLLDAVCDTSLPDYVRSHAASSLKRLGHRLDKSSLDIAKRELLREAKRRAGSVARDAYVGLLECRAADLR